MKEKRQSFMGGAAVLAGAVAVTKLIGALYKIPLGNLLDKEGMAHFYVAYNIYNLMMILSTAGLPLALSRLVSQAHALGQENQKHRIFRVALGMFVALGVVGSGAMLLFPAQLAQLLRDSQAQPAIQPGCCTWQVAAMSLMACKSLITLCTCISPQGRSCS